MRYVALGEICRIVSGSTPRREIKEYWGGDIPWVTPKEISLLKGYFLEDSTEKIAKAGFNSCSTEMLPPGSLLMSSRAPIGLLAINKISVCTNQGFKSLVPSEKVDVLFLFFAMRHYVAQLQTEGRGVTFKELSKTIVAKFKIPLPSLKDQIRIATLLSRVEALITTREDNLRMLDEFLKSTFLEMFGDPVRNQKEFEVRHLSEFYIDPKSGTKCGPFGSALKKEEYVESGVPVWNMDNISADGRFQPKVKLWITNDKFEELRGYSVQNGDILISRAGTVGKMCVLESQYSKSVISTNLIRVRLGKGLLPIYFVSLMTYCKG